MYSLVGDRQLAEASHKSRSTTSAGIQQKLKYFSDKMAVRFGFRLQSNKVVFVDEHMSYKYNDMYIALFFHLNVMSESIT